MGGGGPASGAGGARDRVNDLFTKLQQSLYAADTIVVLSGIRLYIGSVASKDHVTVSPCT